MAPGKVSFCGGQVAGGKGAEVSRWGAMQLLPCYTTHGKGQWQCLYRVHYRHHRQRDGHHDRKTFLQVPSTSTRNMKEMQSPHTRKI